MLKAKATMPTTGPRSRRGPESRGHDRAEDAPVDVAEEAHAAEEGEGGRPEPASRGGVWANRLDGSGYGRDALGLLHCRSRYPLETPRARSQRM